MSNQNPRIDMSDLQRLVRLSEEIRSRLAETAMIMARVTGNASLDGASVRKFISRNAKVKRANAGDGDWVEIIDVDGVESCYGVINGVPFAESPCGAS